MEPRHASLTAIGPILAEIVVEAARLILPLWRSDLAVEAKADKSPVTEADRRAEDLVLDRLTQRFAGVPVISEEHAARHGVPGAIGDRFFLVDPLDGTKAFIRGDPHFTVNIGLVEHGRPVAGAVAAPPSGEVWFADHTAFRREFDDHDGRVIRVRPWPPGDALALTSHTMKAETTAQLAAQYRFARSEAMDSSIKLCRIAEGKADLYPRHGPTMEWDTAAGHAVLIAAGGSLTTSEGDPFVYGKAEAGFRNGWFVARGGPAVTGP